MLLALAAGCSQVSVEVSPQTIPNNSRAAVTTEVYRDWGLWRSPVANARVNLSTAVSAGGCDNRVDPDDPVTNPEGKTTSSFTGSTGDKACEVEITAAAVQKSDTTRVTILP